MRVGWTVAMAVAFWGCDADVPLRDGGPDRDVTVVTVFASIPGGTASVEERTYSVSGDGVGFIEIAPRFVGTSTTLVLERGGASLELPADWSAEYDRVGLPHDTPLRSLTLQVLLAEDGSCVLGMTNGRAGDHEWFGPRSLPLAPCGPFAD